MQETEKRFAGSPPETGQDYLTVVLPMDVDDELAALADDSAHASVNSLLVEFFEKKAREAGGDLRSWLATCRFTSEGEKKTARSRPTGEVVSRRLRLPQSIHRAFQHGAEEVSVTSLRERSHVFNALFARAASEFVAESSPRSKTASTSNPPGNVGYA